MGNEQKHPDKEVVLQSPGVEERLYPTIKRALDDAKEGDTIVTGIRIGVPQRIAEALMKLVGGNLDRRRGRRYVRKNRED